MIPTDAKVFLSKEVPGTIARTFCDFWPQRTKHRIELPKCERNPKDNSACRHLVTLNFEQVCGRLIVVEFHTPQL